MKILVISLPVWKNENNSGNTLSNIFSDFPATFANIYFYEGIPNNSICDKYYQVTDKMVLNHILKHEKVGKSFSLSDIKNTEKEDVTFTTEAKKHKNTFTLFMREVLWKLVKADTKEMYSFIQEFDPDIIYAPTYGNFHMLRIVRKIKKKTNIPLVSYISDDLYSYKDSQNTLFKKINQYFLRRSLIKNFKLYDLFYTMTVEQKQELEPIYGKEIKILRKSAVIPYVKHNPNKVLKIIYAGGIYYGRENTLVSLEKAIKELNKQEKRFELHIYTNNICNIPELNDQENSFMHDELPYNELINAYHDSDITLHVESFDETNASETRLSFSTKILDCLQSGLPVLAICPEVNAGFQYLKREDAAVCIDDANNIQNGLLMIKERYEEYQDKAYACLMKDFDHKKNVNNLYRDFCCLLENKVQ